MTEQTTQAKRTRKRATAGQTALTPQDTEAMQRLASAENKIRDRVTSMERIKAGTLRPNPKNFRTHSAVQSDTMMAVLNRVGFAGACLAYQPDDGQGLMLIDGHLRQNLTPDDVVPVLILDVNDAEADEILASFDPIGAMAGADVDLLQSLLDSTSDLMEEAPALKSMLQTLLDDTREEETVAGETDPDDVPLPPDDPITQPGDLWILGNHRLLCGDSASVADVDALLGGARIHLVNTDPPYNVKVEPRSNNARAAGNSSFAAPKNASGKTHHQSLDLARHPGKSIPTHKQMRAKDRPLENDFVTDAEFDVLLDGWFGNMARSLEPGRGFYIWGGYANCANYPPFLKKHNLYFSQAIIWVKEHPVLTRKDFMGNHEWCFYGWLHNGPHQYLGPNNATDVWSIKKVNPQSMVHLTEKPVELAVRAMQYSSRQGENVMDLFGGSGSTMIAAQQTGRNAFLMEIDTQYCDVIVQRWEKFTGLKAERVPNVGTLKAKPPALPADPDDDDEDGGEDE